MGWSSGSRVATGLWTKLKDLIPIEEHQEAALAIIAVLAEADWDTHYEAPELMVAAYGPTWNEGDI